MTVKPWAWHLPAALATAMALGACVLPSGSTVTGVTYLDTRTTPHRFLSLGLTGDKSDGIILLGTRDPA